MDPAGSLRQGQAGALRDRLVRVDERIARACERVGRPRDHVTLVVVTKARTVAEVEEALGCGVGDIGESYAREAAEKFGIIGHRARWHFVGHLQRNKVKLIAGFADWVHSVDSLRLAEEIGRRCQGLGRRIPVLLEVNAAGEPGKFGLAPGEAAEVAEGVAGVQGVVLRGLMTMAPLVEDPEAVRPVFQRLRALGEELAPLGTPGAPLDQLSMGMTQDFEVAIEEGATMVRIGTAIFGERA